MENEFTLIRSARKTLSLEIARDGSVVVRAPRRLAQKEIDTFVRSHEQWIARHREKAERRIAFAEEHFSTDEQIRALTAEAHAVLPGRVAYWSRIMNVTPAGIRITGAKTRFGSCSAKDSLAFSYRLMAYPADAVDYVVVHELAHIRHKDHSPAFYAFVARFLPDYRRREQLLR